MDPAGDMKKALDLANEIARICQENIEAPDGLTWYDLHRATNLAHNLGHQIQMAAYAEHREPAYSKKVK